MSYRLFIDDEREPVGECVVARSSEEAFRVVLDLGFPTEINFDHDLGGDDTSMKFIWTLVNWMLDNNLQFPQGFEYTIHSQNPVGRENISAMMDSAIKVLGHEQSDN